MNLWGHLLEPGILVEIRDEDAHGLIIKRDEKHLHLWDVLVRESLVSIHTSRLRRL